MFKDERRNPKIIVRNRSAGPLELNEDPRVVFRGFSTGQQHANGRLGEESVKQRLVPPLLRSALKTSLDFA
jgi:hypothetical protein